MSEWSAVSGGAGRSSDSRRASSVLRLWRLSRFSVRFPHFLPLSDGRLTLLYHSDECFVLLPVPVRSQRCLCCPYRQYVFSSSSPLPICETDLFISSQTSSAPKSPTSPALPPASPLPPPSSSRESTRLSSCSSATAGASSSRPSPKSSAWSRGYFPSSRRSSCGTVCRARWVER